MGHLANLDKELKFYQLVLDKKVIVNENGTIYNPKTKKFIARTERRNTLATFTVDGGQIGIIKRRAVWIAFNGPITDPTAKVGCREGYTCELSNLYLMTFEEQREKAGKGIAERIKANRDAGIRMVGGFTPKLDDDTVLSLRRSFKEQPFVLRHKAKELNVTHVTLGAALTGKTFKHLPDPVVNPEYAKSRIAKPKALKPAKVKITSSPATGTRIATPKKENPKTNTTVVKPNLDRVAAIKAAAERMRKRGTV